MKKISSVFLAILFIIQMCVGCSEMIGMEEVIVNSIKNKKNGSLFSVITHPIETVTNFGIGAIKTKITNSATSVINVLTNATGGDLSPWDDQDHVPSAREALKIFMCCVAVRYVVSEYGADMAHKSAKILSVGAKNSIKWYCGADLATKMKVSSTLAAGVGLGLTALKSNALGLTTLAVAASNRSAIAGVSHKVDTVIKQGNQLSKQINTVDTTLNEFRKESQDKFKDVLKLIQKGNVKVLDKVDNILTEQNQNFQTLATKIHKDIEASVQEGNEALHNTIKNQFDSATQTFENHLKEVKEKLDSLEQNSLTQEEKNKILSMRSSIDEVLQNIGNISAQVKNIAEDVSQITSNLENIENEQQRTNNKIDNLTNIVNNSSSTINNINNHVHSIDNKTTNLEKMLNAQREEQRRDMQNAQNSVNEINKKVSDLSNKYDEAAAQENKRKKDDIENDIIYLRAQQQNHNNSIANVIKKRTNSEKEEESDENDDYKVIYSYDLNNVLSMKDLSEAKRITKICFRELDVADKKLAQRMMQNISEQIQALEKKFGADVAGLKETMKEVNTQAVSTEQVLNLENLVKDSANVLSDLQQRMAHVEKASSENKELAVATQSIVKQLQDEMRALANKVDDMQKQNQELKDQNSDLQQQIKNGFNRVETAGKQEIDKLTNVLLDAIRAQNNSVVSTQSSNVQRITDQNTAEHNFEEYKESEEGELYNNKETNKNGRMLTMYQYAQIGIAAFNLLNSNHQY